MLDPRDDPTWRAASHGASKMRWGAARFAGREWALHPSGKQIRLSSFASAQRLANRLNDRGMT